MVIANERTHDIHALESVQKLRVDWRTRAEMCAFVKPLMIVSSLVAPTAHDPPQNFACTRACELESLDTVYWLFRVLTLLAGEILHPLVAQMYLEWAISADFGGLAGCCVSW